MTHEFSNSWALYNAIGTGWLIAWCLFIGYERRQKRDWLRGDVTSIAVFFVLLGVLIGNYLNFHQGLTPRYKLPAICVSIGVTIGYVSSVLTWRQRAKIHS